MPKPPVETELFVEMTALNVHAIASHVMKGQTLISENQKRWFACLCDHRLRYLYANNAGWREKLKSENSREFAFKHVELMLQDFVQSPASYKNRHPLDKYGVTEKELNEVVLY